MEGRWNPIGTQFLCFLVFIVGVGIHGSWSLNDEGLVLFKFRSRVRSDPHGALANWNLRDGDPCMWSGVHCVAGKVHILNLTGCSLEGTLAPELGKLVHLRSIVLRNNCFSGILPSEIGNLKKLEILDLRNNYLSGAVPAEIGRSQTLKCLSVSGNKFRGTIPGEMRRLKLLSHLELDESLASSSASEFKYVNCKNEDDTWMMRLKKLWRAYSHAIPFTKSLREYLHSSSLFQTFNARVHPLQPVKGSCCCCSTTRPPADSTSDVPHLIQNVEILVNFARRRRLQEQPSNLVAEPTNDRGQNDVVVVVPITKGSGSFPAVPNSKSPSSPPSISNDASSDHNAPSESPKGPIIHNHVPPSFWDTWIYFVFALMAVVLMALIVIMIVLCRRRGMRHIGPWRSGISVQLQNALVSGIPKLNRSELETACEDFSNIINSYDGFIVYKGTLSSGIEIAVASTTTTYRKEWSRNAEKAYRRKIDTLSKVNHKNFTNLIGFCEEDEPFNRMMVFEYAPNGTLFEHIHIKDMEHLDWTSRMRIIMGVAYCLKHMHDLKPPVSHTNLTSSSIFLTDDYAAKIAEISFLSQAASKPKPSSEDEGEHSELPPIVDPEANVYNFGIILLEVISGKLPYSEKEGPIEKWAKEYLSDKSRITQIVDSSLKAFKTNQLEVICEIVQECIISDPRQRPSMSDIVPRLKEVIPITQDQAAPRLSPLWWAELEILSQEAN
ncbi:unnamed protein product [Linum tenue]|uniref:Protein kinase domain-containing protein n=1 Tax=Linum tenue TaxID=586396 RepID=A0AAV0RKS8_9ROSI|nr:unnamed protein product [Linum tenue]